MLRRALFVLLLWAVSAAATPLAPLLDGYPPDGPGIAVHVSLPGAAWTVTAGRLRPGGRAVAVEDRFLLASASKIFLAVALMRVHEAGRLDVDAPAAPLLPRATVAGLGGLRGVTVAHLLTMTSGLPEYLDAAFEEDWLDDPEGWHAVEALDYAQGYAPAFAPGRGFDYSNTNYLLAQLVLEAVTGKPMADALAAHALRPAGLTAAGVVGAGPPRAGDVYGHGARGVLPPHRSSPGFGDGPVIASAAEAAAFWRALLIERRLLGPAALARLMRDDAGTGYGMGIELETWRGIGPVWGHSGGDVGFSADIRVFPHDRLVVVVLRAAEDHDPDLVRAARDLALGR